MFLFNQHNLFRVIGIIIINNSSSKLGSAMPSKQEAISSPEYGKPVGFEKYLF